MPSERFRFRRNGRKTPENIPFKIKKVKIKRVKRKLQKIFRSIKHPPKLGVSYSVQIASPKTGGFIFYNVRMLVWGDQIGLRRAGVVFSSL